MRISSFRIQNYKSYEDSQTIRFSSGINLVIGQNNVGKTALLEALALKFTAKPHKSLQTLPKPTSSISQSSIATVTFNVSGEELRGIILDNFIQFNVHVPIPSEREHEADADLSNLLSNLLEQNELELEVNFVSSTGTSVAKAQPQKSPALGNYTTTIHDNGRLSCIVYSVAPDKQSFLTFNHPRYPFDPQEEVGVKAASYLTQRIYNFKAERVIGISSIGTNTELAPDASNLAEVLLLLQTTNPDRFREYNKIIKEIFPFISEIGTRPLGNNNVTVVIWTEDPQTQRNDLAIELTESGTGIGQVLAMLYVAINSYYPKTIIIEEPSSFLNPGAARKLIEVLKSFSQHQFIMTTHSPEIIAASEPKALILIKYEKPKSIVESLDATNVEDISKTLLEIGAKLSDVYGSDNIIWVEGTTEEKAFKLILPLIADSHVGLNIVAVCATGDFENKRIPAKMIFDVYKNLSNGNALIPSALAFIFDQETRSERQQLDLIRASENKIHFLRRRTFENYLLDEDALFAIYSKMLGFEEVVDIKAAIKSWMQAHGKSNKYDAQNFEIYSPEWLTLVNAPKLLEDMVQDLSNKTATYKKTTHSIELTKWIIKNKPNLLDDLSALLKKVCSA